MGEEEGAGGLEEGGCGIRYVPQIVELGGFDAGFVEHLYAFGECYPYGGVAWGKLEVACAGVDLLYDLCQALVFFSCLEGADDED